MATLSCNMKGIQIRFRPDFEYLQITKAQQEAENLLNTTLCSYIQQRLSGIILHEYELRNRR